MKLRSIYKLIIFAIFLGVLSSSCEELPCEYPDGVQLHAGFYTSTGVAISDTLIGDFNLVLLNNTDNPYSEDYPTAIESISFPFAVTEDTSTVIITFENLEKDTITFRYNRTLALKSHPCGFDTFFEITEIVNTNNQIDSIWIKKDIVEYGSEENIKIYF